MHAHCMHTHTCTYAHTYMGVSRSMQMLVDTRELSGVAILQDISHTNCFQYTIYSNDMSTYSWCSVAAHGNRAVRRNEQYFVWFLPRMHINIKLDHRHTVSFAVFFFCGGWRVERVCQMRLFSCVNNPWPYQNYSLKLLPMIDLN